MEINAYNGISSKEIKAQRITSEGKVYSLNHPNSLVVNMRFVGQKNNSANSQGWERSSQYYFKELQKKHPEFFSKKNSYRIGNGESPKVDKQFVNHFPQYKGFENETLIHHHIGKDGQAVALPQSVHKGSGEIHVYENRLGITKNAQCFSDKCQSICEHDPSMINKTKDDFIKNQKDNMQRTNAIFKISDNQSNKTKTNTKTRIINKQNTLRKKH